MFKHSGRNKMGKATRGRVRTNRHVKKLYGGQPQSYVPNRTRYYLGMGYFVLAFIFIMGTLYAIFG